MGRHPTGSRSSFPTKMASKYEEIYTEGNSVNDLTGFKAGKTLGKLTRKKGEGWSRLATLSSSTTLSSLAGIGRKTSSKGVLLPPCRELKAPVLPAMIRSSSGLNKALEEGSIFPVLLPGACATQGPLTGFPHHSLPEKKGGKKKDEKRCRSSDSLSGIRCIWKWNVVDKRFGNSWVKSCTLLNLFHQSFSFSFFYSYYFRVGFRF